MRFSVTGSTGLVGNNVVRRLVAMGHQPTVLARKTSDPRPLENLPIHCLHGDIVEPDVVQKLVDAADVVIHCAAHIQIGWSRLEHSRQVNVDATAALARQCHAAGIRLVHVSTVDTLAAALPTGRNNESDLLPRKTPCSYVVSKREAEEAVLRETDLGLDAVIVNPGFMVGPWDWKPSSGQMMLAIARQIVPMTPGGGCSAVDVRSVADGLIAAAEHGGSGQRYIFGGENMTYLDLWRQMAQVTGRLRPLAAMPNWFASLAGSVGDLTGKLFGREMQVNSAATQMGQLYHYYDSSKAMTELGYRPGPVRPALEDAWQWFQEHGYVRNRRR